MPLPPSIYAETAIPAVPTPPLPGDAHVDVAVVGGGYTGLSTALHLAERGVGVTVLEANEPGWGASGRNGGQVNPGLKHDPDAIEAQFGPDLGKRMVAFSGGAPDYLFELVRRHGIECEARQAGTVRAACGAADMAAVRATGEQLLRRGLPVELLDRPAVRRATGTDRYAGALLDRRGGSVNPLGLARGLAAAALRAGARVHGGTAVEGIVRSGGGWALQTRHGTLRCERLVIGTNGYTDDAWPGLRRTVVPVRSGIIASEPLPDALAAEIMPTRSVLYEAGAITVYYRLDAQNRILMGGRSGSADIAGPDALAWLRSYTVRLWPAVAGLRWTHGWNGRVAMTADHYPHLHEPAEGVLLCLGYNGRGVAMSTAMGGELARRLTGTPRDELNMPLTALRAIPFHGLWPVGVAARVAWGRLRDRLGF